MGHRVMIKTKLDSISVKNPHSGALETFQIYQADDAWYGQAGVFDHRMPAGGKIGDVTVEKWVEDFRQKHNLDTIHTFSKDAYAPSRNAY
jgi:hypothetical protein